MELKRENSLLVDTSMFVAIVSGFLYISTSIYLGTEYAIFKIPYEFSNVNIDSIVFFTRDTELWYASFIFTCFLSALFIDLPLRTSNFIYIYCGLAILFLAILWAITPTLDYYKATWIVSAAILVTSISGSVIYSNHISKSGKMRFIRVIAFSEDFRKSRNERKMGVYCMILVLYLTTGCSEDLCHNDFKYKTNYYVTGKNDDTIVIVKNEDLLIEKPYDKKTRKVSERTFFVKLSNKVHPAIKLKKNRAAKFGFEP